MHLAITARLGDFVRFMDVKFAYHIPLHVEHQPRQLHTLLVSAKQITLDTLIPVLSFPNL